MYCTKEQTAPRVLFVTNVFVEMINKIKYFFIPGKIPIVSFQLFFVSWSLLAISLIFVSYQWDFAVDR